MSEAQTYDFHLIFKGLFRCVPSEDRKRLTVLMVDARSPQASEITKEPLRDHRAAIEFHLRDWRKDEETPKSIRGFAEVKKANKDAVGLFLLTRNDIRIDVEQGRLSPPLSFIEDGTKTSFSRLPRMEEIAPNSARVRQESLTSGDGCIARVVDLDRGEVRSERTSMDGEEPATWSFSVPRERKILDELIKTINTPGAEHENLKEELLAKSREINLDLRVTTKVPIDSAVIISTAPFPDHAPEGDLPVFKLRPEPGKNLELWIKNRELDVILTESDEPEDKGEGCRERVDFDFELLYALSEKPQPQEIVIPYRSKLLNETRVVLAGCACGGCA